MPTPIKTRQAEPWEAPHLGVTIATAFDPLPQTVWLVPDHLKRREIMPPYFAVLVEHAMTHGAVITDENSRSVAVWLHVNPPDIPDPVNYTERLREIAGPDPEQVQRFLDFDTVRAAVHPLHRGPHHYLALLAVLPEHQGQGYGTALLRQHHEVCDRLGINAYLEAASRRSRALYLREGYEVFSEAFALSGGPLMWPMWRPHQHETV